MIGEGSLSRTIDMQYLIVDCPSPYNIILGRPALNMFRTVVSTFHLCVKFQAQDGRIATVRSDRQQARQCYNASLKRSATKQESHQEVKAIHSTNEILSLAELDPREDTQERPQPADELIKVQLTTKPEQVTYIGQALQGQQRIELITTLQANADLFTWTPADMPGIDPSIICHRLAINRAIRPIAQKKRNLGTEKSKAALEETRKLLSANFVKEIRFTTWLSNVVMSNAIWSKECRCNLPTADGQSIPSPNSSALVIETGKTQQPVYFVSRVMQSTEQRYPRIEQLALALVITARRLRHYFQSHTIIVRTNQPLRQILTKPELDGRLTKWSIELSEFDIQYQPRTALKAQILADFISELTLDEHNKHWELHVDRASSRGGSGAGIILKERDKVVAEQSLQFHFPASNNQAEYEALIAGLKLAISLQAKSLIAYCDSLLVVQQIRGEFQVKDPLLERYWLIAKDLISKFNSFIILHIHRENNVRADVLSKLAATRADTQTSALSQLTLQKLSTELLSITNINHLRDWRTPFLEYINAGIMPRDEPNPQSFRRKASLYTNIAGELYRHGFSQPLLKFLSKDEAHEVMNEVHEGVCGNHIGGWALAAKIVRIGYFWPTMRRDCITKVKPCDKYQKHAAISTRPAEALHSMEVSWPFHRWGLDILGPFPIAPGQVKFFLVSIDYFSKWIEAQPLAKITAKKVRSLIWKNIICRFGIPKEIVSNNGRQFTDNKLGSFLKNFHIQHYFSSVEHPQTNGQAEAANRVILQAVKKKLDNAKGEWAELIPEVLWSYNTTIQTTTGETPFKLVYGSEALLPVEVGIPTLRTDLYDEQHNISARNAELDLAEEDREIAAIKQRAQKQLAERSHNKRVVPRIFEEGDLVLRRTEEARRPPHMENSLQTGRDHSEYPECSEWGPTSYKYYKEIQCQEIRIFLP
ncbi:uncharacterized protein [Arachis hypogaea]|uniref:uncharacterized protein n=1 Tax=Arachis hypogaea TaxID=3818 RepID=UPI003B218904